jgi:hypothetical protein
MEVLEQIGSRCFSNEFRKSLCKESLAITQKYRNLVENAHTDENEKIYWQMKKSVLALKASSKLFDNF